MPANQSKVAGNDVFGFSYSKNMAILSNISLLFLKSEHINSVEIHTIVVTSDAIYR